LKSLAFNYLTQGEFPMSNRSFNNFCFSAVLSGFLTLISLTTVFAQIPTPTPVQYPPFPNPQFTGFNAYPDPALIGRDDFIFHKAGTTGLYYINGSNDNGGSEIYLTSATNRYGNLTESSCFCGPSTSSKQVVRYSNSSSQIGFDQGTYFTATKFIETAQAPYSNLATINIFSIPNDGAESVGPNCPPSVELPPQTGSGCRQSRKCHDWKYVATAERL
jgi:hypothetical protein